MMTLRAIKDVLARSPEKAVRLRLADGTPVPVHFHVTEVGHVRKAFVDCGGSFREEEKCVLQAWVAHDTDHRITAAKLSGIIGKAARLFPHDDLEVEVEYEAEVVSQYPVVRAAVDGDAIVFELGTKHTDCLAKEVCGVAEVPEQAAACCGDGG